jgi:hypothetical protein
MRSLLRALIAIWLCVTIATTAAGSRTSADGLPKAKIAAPAATGVAVRRTSKALLTHVRRQRCHARLEINGNINAGANDVRHCAHERMRACAHTHHIQPICERTPCAVRRLTHAPARRTSGFSQEKPPRVTPRHWGFMRTLVLIAMLAQPSHQQGATRLDWTGQDGTGRDGTGRDGT